MMKPFTAFAVGLLLCTMVLSSQAFLFNDNMWMLAMMYPQMFGGMFGGGQQGGAGSPGMNPMSLAMLASGSDNLKNLGTGMLLSNMFRGQGAGAPPTGR